MGLCETSNFSIFTFSSASNFTFCTCSYSICFSQLHDEVRMGTFAKWWCQKHCIIEYFFCNEIPQVTSQKQTFKEPPPHTHTQNEEEKNFEGKN